MPTADSRQWAGRCSNPRLRFFRPPLDHLSYQPKRKKPGISRRLAQEAPAWKTWRHKRNGHTGSAARGLKLWISAICARFKQEADILASTIAAENRPFDLATASFCRA